MRWLTFLAAALFAGGVLGLYLLVGGHRADLSRMPGEPPPAVSAPAAAPQPDVAAPQASATPAPDAAPADPLAAAVERLRSGLPASPAPGEADAAAALPDAASPAAAPPDLAAGDGADDPAQAGVVPPDSPSASSAEAAPTGSVRAGAHTTALGVHWTLLPAGEAPAFVIHLGGGQDAHVQVSPQFLALNLHAMSRNVENVRFLILHDYLGQGGDYLFLPDGRLARQ